MTSQSGELINFHDDANYGTYVGRRVDPSWLSMFEGAVPVAGKVVADVGCGGGLYAQALARLRAKLVIGIDFSAVSLASAARLCAGIPHVQFVRSTATATALKDDSVDVVVERALIHHFKSLAENFAEVRRILVPGGVFWLQDRTIADVLLAASPEHIRGYYLQYLPQLREIEVARRRHETVITSALEAAGFVEVRARRLVEARKTFNSFAELKDEIVTRRGRSILHALTDAELERLADRIGENITVWPVRERDTWTVWTSAAPPGR
jgi:ubiquinone/menaquinone biosynthesis C-methylase UbiE